MKLWHRICGMIIAGGMCAVLHSAVMIAQAEDMEISVEVSTNADAEMPVAYDLQNTVIYGDAAAESEGSVSAASETAAVSDSNAIRTNCSYMYDMLETAEEQEFYDELLSICKEIDASDEVYTATPYASCKSIGTQRGMEIAWIFHYDHPEFFWLEPEMLVLTGRVAFSVLDDYQDGAVRKATKADIFAEVQMYIDGAMQYEAPYDRAKYLYQTLHENVTYQAGEWDQTIASTFLERQTVCAGFSKAYALLCNAVGVDTVSVSSCSHAWNAVCLSGNWYNVDVTNQNWLLSAAEMREKDISSGITYQVTYKVGDSEEQKATYYTHDIYLQQYPYYAEKFPLCEKSYNGSDGKLALRTGDVNGDEIVTVADVVLLQKYLLSQVILTKVQTDAADVWADGVVNGIDLTMLRQIII